MSYDLLQHGDIREMLRADIASAVDTNDADAALKILQKYGDGLREILKDYKSEYDEEYED